MSFLETSNLIQFIHGKVLTHSNRSICTQLNIILVYSIKTLSKFCECEHHQNSLLFLGARWEHFSFNLEEKSVMDVLVCRSVSLCVCVCVCCSFNCPTHKDTHTHSIYTVCTEGFLICSEQSHSYIISSTTT